MCKYKKCRGKTEDEYRQIFEETYCKHENPIITFDGIRVKFFPDMFDHAFFESADWKKKDKSNFSVNRAENIYWIKDTLEDPNAILKAGYIKKSKSYTNSRRVAIVKGNYIVVILINKKGYAKFITAYEADKNIGKIFASPDWVGLK